MGFAGEKFEVFASLGVLKFFDIGIVAISISLACVLLSRIRTMMSLHVEKPLKKDSAHAEMSGVKGKWSNA